MKKLRKWDVSLFIYYLFNYSSFLAKFSPLQNMKVAIYKGFVILGR
jgi:hypothetical protein